MFLTRLKQLRKRFATAPGFTAVALITIAAGVGANTTVFAVVNAVLLKPLPYPQPERLIAIWLKAPGLGIAELNPSPSTYTVFREQNRTFVDVGLWGTDSLSLSGAGKPEQLDTLALDDSTLRVLGAETAIGRIFAPHDDTFEAPKTVMLSYGYWKQKFGGDPAVIGRQITLDNLLCEVIGVLAPDFHFLDQHPAVIEPMQFERSKMRLGNFSYHAMARLRPGVTMGQATADVARMLAIVQRSFAAPPGFTLKQFEDAHISPNLRTLAQDVVGDIGRTLWVLMGTIGMVMLIACANVANLLLVRADGRQQEFAIRAALGANWGQIALEILYESVALGLAGGLLGLGIAFGALRILVRLAPQNLPRLEEISIDGHVVLFTLLISTFAGLLFGLVPVLKYAGLRINTNLRAGGRASSQSRERHRTRNALVVLQVMLALVLLVTSGLMIRTMRSLLKVDPGFTHPEQIETAVIDIPEAEIKDPERVARAYDAILQKVTALHGVAAAAMIADVPLSGSSNFDPVFAKDHTYSERDVPLHRYQFATPGYFRVMGTRVVTGRDFSWEDLYGKRPVAIVSEQLARGNWGGARQAIGKYVRGNLTGPWREVIGVAPDMRYDGVDKKAPTTVYWPLLAAQFQGDDIHVRRNVTLAVRSGRSGSESFVNEMRQAVWSVDNNLPLANINTVAQYYKKSMARTSFLLLMLSVASGMALILGLVGIYGVIAYSISQRTREIGIRMAVGAEPRQLLYVFLRSGLLLTGVGVLLGIAVSTALTHLMGSLLFGVNPLDPLTYAAGSLGLFGAALLASYIPSLRALKVDPVEALRAE